MNNNKYLAAVCANNLQEYGWRLRLCPPTNWFLRGMNNHGGGRWLAVDSEGFVTRCRSKRQARSMGRLRRYRRKSVEWDPLYGMWRLR